MKDNNFDINSFMTPEVSCAPVYIWVWNDICSREIIDTQLEEMENLGIRAFYILPEPENFRPDSMPTNLTPDYLTDEYFELCAYAFDEAKKRGMNCWIYDEGGWPSGSACGKVMKDHPEFGRETLECIERSFFKGEKYKKSDDNILASFINDEKMIEDGYVFGEDSVVIEYFTEKDTDSNYPDLLNKDATDYFINITHKKYPLKDNVKALFTDEPKAPAWAFNKGLSEKYEALYKESVLPYLPLIAERVEVTEENVHILHRWYDLCSKMFCENFLLPCKKWANDNKMAFTGHLDKDHDPAGCMRGGNNFNLMRALRCFDIPGIDVIWRQLYPENEVSEKDEMNGYNGFFPRYASSAAEQNGTEFALSEILGVAGAAVSYDIMRYTVGYQVVRGINIFNPFNFPLGRKGQLLAQELPIFTESQPYYKHLKQFNKYAERLSYLSLLGERVCETGLYYPVCDFQGRLKTDEMAEKFEKLGRSLEEKMVDFHIVDDDVIQNSCVSDEGYIRIGKAKYRHIIIPEGAFIPKKTQEVLNRFTENGGVVSDSLSDCTPAICAEGEGLRVMHRKSGNEEIYFLFRECGESGDYRIHLNKSEGYLLNVEKGELQTLKAENNILNISLAVGETAVILLTDKKYNAEIKKEFKRKTEIQNVFSFRKETELICNENGFCNIEHSQKEVTVNSGDWSDLIGREYSGSCVYETTFILPEDMVGKAGEITLGDVRFQASVYLNDRFLGVSLFSPHKVEIPEGVLSKNNHLKIVVTNTSANWYVHTDYFDKWDIKELSSYFIPELKYAEDFVSGGLYGPVVIYTQ